MKIELIKNGADMEVFYPNKIEFKVRDNVASVIFHLNDNKIMVLRADKVQEFIDIFKLD